MENKFYRTFQSVFPVTKYLTNGIWIYMVPQFKPKSMLILGYGAGTVAGLTRLLYGNNVKIVGIDIEPCEANYEVKVIQVDARNYIKNCDKFNVILVDLYDMKEKKIPDFVYEEWFVKDLAEKGDYIIVSTGPSPNMKYYRKHLRRYGSNKPNRLSNRIWYFGTKDYEHLIIR